MPSVPFLRWLGLSLVISLALLSACRIDVTSVVVDWDHDPGALIVEADTFIDPMLSQGDLNRIPDARVWGDGRIVWAEYRDDGSRVAWEGYLSEGAMTNLLQFIFEEGFFDWKDHYQPGDPLANSPFSYIVVHMPDRSKRVSQYLEGAPVGFWRIYRRINQGVTDAHPLTLK